MNTGKKDTEGRTIYKEQNKAHYVINSKGEKSYKYTRRNNNNTLNIGKYYIVNRSKIFTKNGTQTLRNSDYLKLFIGSQKLYIQKTNSFPNKIRNAVPNLKEVVHCYINWSALVH